MRLGAALAVAGAMGLGGCVTTQMDDGLGFMVGQPIQSAVAKLGYPSSQREILGDTVYVWGTSHSGVVPIVNTSTTQGYVGSIPIGGTQTSTSYIPVNYNCTIELGAGPDGIIKSWRWEGNLGGCARYARALAH